MKVMQISVEERRAAATSVESAQRSFSVASVSVAYNGARVLSRHLDALKRQTTRLDEMIVVNNASTDATANVIQISYPDVTLLNLPENSGVGGGFAAGLQYAAIDKKYDWVWLFDQDSIPADDALEQLLGNLKYLADAERTAILAPWCVHAETKVTFPGHIWRHGRFLPVQEKGRQPITLVDSVISSGTLIRKQAIEAVGLPRPDLFMDFVDYEHCLRLRRHGFNIAVVRDSLVHHVLGEPRQIKVLGRTKYWTDHAPWREYYMTRNEMFTVWQYFPTWSAKRSTFYRLAWHALEILLFGKQKVACLRMMSRGVGDGRAGRLGTRFLPPSDRSASFFVSESEKRSAALSNPSEDQT